MPWVLSGEEPAKSTSSSSPSTVIATRSVIGCP
jgi:hypothetical protein